MSILDLGGRHDVGRGVHFGIEVEGRVIAYAYIRKNACSAFKRLFQFLSEASEKDAITLMYRHHRLRLPQVQAADMRICVLRDPEGRTRSLFKNKFIQRRGHEAIFASYAAITGRDPAVASYADFVEHYLSNPLETLDPHVQTQFSCLMPVRYDLVLRLDTLARDMAAIVGPQNARRFFAERHNATSTAAEYDDPAAHVPSDRLAERYAATGAMPGAAALFDPDLSVRLARIYARDHALLACVAAA